MVNIPFIYVGSLENWPKFCEDWATRFYPGPNGEPHAGRATLKIVVPLIACVNKPYDKQFKEDMCSFTTYWRDKGVEYEGISHVNAGDKVEPFPYTYPGFHWKNLRSFINLAVRMFGGWFRMSVFQWPERSSLYMAQQARMGRHYNGTIIPLGEIPDQVLNGAEQV